MNNDLPVAALVTRAAHGDSRASDALVERFAPLIWSICRRYQPSGADAEDVGQAVWLRLVEHLGELRDPAALGGWLATTTRRECEIAAELGIPIGSIGPRRRRCLEKLRRDLPVAALVDPAAVESHKHAAAQR